MHKKLYNLFYLGLIFLFGSCQTAPTRIVERTEVPVEYLAQTAKEPIELRANTVVLDARSLMDYSSVHIPESYNLDWRHLAPASGRFSGRQEPDLERLTRRLSLLGIEPKTEVLVVGYGAKGKGEEGRLAWVLYLLGISKVRFVGMEYFNTRLTNLESQPPKNVTAWKPVFRSSVIATTDELKRAISRPAEVIKSSSGSYRTHILDVRSEKEFFNLEGSFIKNPIPNLGATNIPWLQFFDSYGRANLSIQQRLLELGWKKGDRILVISERGVRSAAVTMALVSMGFFRAANYSDGLLELMKDFPKSGYRG